MDNKKYLKLTLFLVLINFLIRLPLLNLPAHHDELSYFEGALRVYGNNLNPFIEFWGYKPPLFYELAAIFFKIFWPSRIWGRAISAFLSSLCLFFTYLLGKKLFSIKAGLYGTVLLAFFPLFITQSFLYQPPVFITFFTLVSLYYYFQNNKIRYFIFASLLVLTHEIAIFIPILIFCFNLIEEIKHKDKTLFSKTKDGFFLLLPLFFFLIWMILNKKYLGWFLWPHHFSLLTSNRAYARDLFSYIFNIAAKDHFLWFILGFILSTLIYSINNKKLRIKVIRNEPLLFIFIFFFYLLIFYWLDFLPRYSMFLYPLIFLTFVWFLENILFNKEKVFIFFIWIICLIFSFINFYNLFFYPFSTPFAGERDLSFLRMMFIQKKVANYIETNFSDSLVISIWPHTQIFEKPFYGYVEDKIDSLYCVTDEEESIVKELLKEKRYKNVLLISSTIYGEPKCLSLPNKMIKEINLTDRWDDKILIYKLK